MAELAIASNQTNNKRKCLLRLK